MKLLVLTAFVFVCVSADVSADVLPELNDIALAKPIQRKGVCRDMFLSCPRWAELGACESSRYTDGQKKAYCRRTCKLCKRHEKKKGGGKESSEEKPGDKDDDKTPLDNFIDALKGLKGQLDKADK